MSGYVSNMISSLKANDRRKNKHDPFSGNQKDYKKGKYLKYKDLNPKDKIKLLAQLKENRKYEEQLRVYKLFVSLGVTVIVIGVIVFTIKAVYF